jgi:hypothetical protein
MEDFTFMNFIITTLVPKRKAVSTKGEGKVHPRIGYEGPWGCGVQV